MPLLVTFFIVKKNKQKNRIAIKTIFVGKITKADGKLCLVCNTALATATFWVQINTFSPFKGASINEPFNIHECDELKWFSYFVKSPTTTFNFILCQIYYLFLEFLYYDFIKYDFFSIQMMSLGTLIGGDCDFNLNTVNQDVVIYPLCRQYWDPLTS